MSKYNLTRFTGGQRVVELEDGATKGAKVGIDLFYNGVLVRPEDIFNPGVIAPAPETPDDVYVSAWSLLMDIPPPITQLAEMAGTGFVFVTSPTSYSVVDTTGAVPGSVPQYDGADWVMGTALSNPMTTLGDVIVGGVAGAPDRLGIGAPDQVLGESGGVPAYVDRVIEVQAGTNVTVDNTDPMRPIVASTGGGSSADGGIGVSIGVYEVTSPDLATGFEVTSIADAGYDLTGEWYMWCYPSGSVEIDVWVDSFGTIPTVGDSITGGAEPAIVAGTFDTDTFPGGPITVARTDTLIAHINAASGVKWVKLLLIGTRT